jgi:lipopolysaccharide transport system ATP-binding protein
MADIPIRVAHLGKKYILSHQARGGHKKYTALRDVLTEAAMAPLRNFRRRLAQDPRNSAQASANSKSSEEFWALKDVSFEIKRGESVGIIGRNGAGKSTLLKLLSRITAPTTGRIELDGKVASLLEVGTGFHPELTGRENIYLNGAILGMRRGEIKSKFDEIVDFAEVEKFLDTPVKHYSSGMYVRLAFAVAAHLEPDVLVVDEVLAVGDASFQKKCLGKMRDVSQSGRTVLFVSHNMGAITQLTTRCILLAKGQVAYVGDPAVAIEKYANLGGGDSLTFFDVDALPRPYPGNRQARIVSLRFERKVPQFSADEPFSFVIKIRAHQELPKLRTSITIYSGDGAPVGGVFSADTQKMPVSESEYRVTLPDHCLAPGHYYAAIGIGRGNPSREVVDYDVITETLHFEVYPGKGEGGTVANWTSAWGRIMFPELQFEPLK